MTAEQLTEPVPETTDSTDGRSPEDDRPEGRDAGRWTINLSRLTPQHLSRLSPRVRDVLAVAAYWLAAIAVTSRLWLRPEYRAVSPNWQDQILFEWFLAHAARVLTHLENPLFTTRLNVPFGVNMMANTSAFGITMPLTPVTLLFGAAASYALWCIIALALTATTWYFFLSRGLRLNRLAAAIGGTFCGFAPGMISHLHGQPNISSLFVVPLILWQVIRLTQPGRTVWRGVVLGLLIVYQAFINEEILFITAWGCAMLTIGYAAMRWQEARKVIGRAALGLGVAVGVAAVLLAYPLWYQFYGPQHYSALPQQFQNHVADLGSFTAYSTESLGELRGEAHFSLTPVENNSFYGWPLVITVALIVVWLRREMIVRLAAIIGAIFAIFALGDELTYGRHPTGVSGPWLLLDHVPPFEMVVPTRLALFSTMAIGVILAVSIDRVWVVGRVAPPPFGNYRLPTYRVMWMAALVAILLPVIPTRLNTAARQPAPVFLSSGAWRAYVTPDQSVVPLPLPISREGRLDAMAWAAETELAFRIPHGYFLGPDAESSVGEARFGRNPTAFSVTMGSVERKFEAADVTPQLRADMIRDLREWNAAIIVLRKTDRRAGVLRTTIEQFAGPAQSVDDVWLWDVRPLVANS